MYNACGLLFLSFGFTMLKFITCFSSGSLLESECQGMNISHGVSAQSTDAPFKIEPETVEVSDLRTNITVSLLADAAPFRGFMLDARMCDTCESAGRFSLIDPGNSELICDGRAVAQTNNLQKTVVKVSWIPEEIEVFFFRAAFIEDFNRFWLRKPIIRTSTAAPTTEATSHSTQTSPTDTSQTAPLTSEATSTQTIPTTSPTILTTTSNLDSHFTDTSQTAPPTSEPANTQRIPTTSPTIFTTMSNIDSHLTDTSQTAPLTSEATSTQKIPTTSPTIFTTTSNIDSHFTDMSQTAPPTSEPASTQKIPTTSPIIFTTTSNIGSHFTDTSQTAPLTSEATSTQKIPTTSPTILTTTSNIDSHFTDMSQTAPPTSEPASTQKIPTTSPTIFTTTSNIGSHFTDMSQTAPPTSEATSTQKIPTTSPTIFTGTSNIHSYATDTSQTAPPTSEATSTQKILTTSPTIFTTTSNMHSHATVGPTPPPQCVQYTRCALALLLFSRLCFLGGSSLLMIIRPVLKMATMIASVIELTSKTIAVIFILIKLIKYECECDSLQIAFTALTVTAMVSSLLHTITVFLHCGPSHELKKCWLCALIIVDLSNTIITTTAVFFGIWCFKELWLLILMGVYVICEFMLYLGSVCFENMGKYDSRGKLRKNMNHILETRISPWLFMFIIFSVLNVMFTAALMTGVSLVKM